MTPAQLLAGLILLSLLSITAGVVLVFGAGWGLMAFGVQCFVQFSILYRSTLPRSTASG
jgi:hypothetical protein